MKKLAIIGLCMTVTGTIPSSRRLESPRYEIVELAKRKGLKIDAEGFSNLIRGLEVDNMPIIIDTRHRKGNEQKDYRFGQIPLKDSPNNLIIEVDEHIDPWSIKYFDENISEPKIRVTKFEVGGSEYFPSDFIEYLQKIIGENPNKNIYILCQAGIRSSSFALYLKRFYGINSRSVEGGFNKLDKDILEKLTILGN